MLFKKRISDAELKSFCIKNNTETHKFTCANCPHGKACDEYIDKHNGNTPCWEVIR